MGYALAATETTPPAHYSFNAVFEVIRGALQEKVFPGCVCAIAQGPDLLFHEAFGHFSYAPLSEDAGLQRVSLESVYDVDSLTSSLVTTSLAMKAVEEGRIQLTDRVSRHVHGFGVFGKSPLKIEDLLRHESGLPVTEYFYQQVGSLRKDLPFGTPIGRGVAQHVVMLMNRLQPKTAIGQTAQYSEINSLVLGHLLEELWAKRLDKLAQQILFSPLGIRGSGFIDHGLVRQGKFALDPQAIVPSEECPWRKRVLQGEVRDENTWAMGGISGEAGVFANAADITTLVQALLASYRGVSSSFLAPGTVRTFFQSGDPSHSWALGWAKARTAFGVEVPDSFQGSLGAVSPTGCATWFDPQTSLSVVLLSNTTMPHRSNRKAGQFWPRLLKSVWTSVS